MLSVSFARSPHAHARIDRIETAEARSMPGVALVVTAAELRVLAKPLAPRLEGA